MGTNFRWAVAEVPELLPLLGCEERDAYEDMDPAVHLGKRSAAGLYCWDCDCTLCADGPAGVHTGRSRWYARCPQCGQEPVKASLSEGAVAVELGFAQPNQGRPSGVRSCSSFSWAQDPEKVGALCQAHLDEELIEDEYGRRYTCRAFLDMLKHNCPLQFTDSIGQWFS